MSAKDVGEIKNFVFGLFASLSDDEKKKLCEVSAIYAPEFDLKPWIYWINNPDGKKVRQNRLQTIRQSLRACKLPAIGLFLSCYNDIKDTDYKLTIK